MASKIIIELDDEGSFRTAAGGDAQVNVIIALGMLARAEDLLLHPVQPPREASQRNRLALPNGPLPEFPGE